MKTTNIIYKLHSNEIFPLLKAEGIYHQTGALICLYDDFEEGRRQRRYDVIVAYHKDKPIGVVVCDKRLRTNSYVERAYRNRGVAIGMISKLREEIVGDRVLTGDAGYAGYEKYYERAGIVLTDTYNNVPSHWLALYGYKSMTMDFRLYLKAHSAYQSHVKRNAYQKFKENKMASKLRVYEKEIAHIESVGGTVSNDLKFSLYDGVVTGTIVGKNLVNVVQVVCTTKNTKVSRRGPLSVLIQKGKHKHAVAFNDAAKKKGLDIRMYPDCCWDNYYLYVVAEGNFVTAFRQIMTPVKLEQFIQYAKENYAPSNLILPAAAATFSDVHGTDFKVRVAGFCPVGEGASEADFAFLSQMPLTYYMLARHD